MIFVHTVRCCALLHAPSYSLHTFLTLIHRKMCRCQSNANQNPTAEWRFVNRERHFYRILRHTYTSKASSVFYPRPQSGGLLELLPLLWCATAMVCELFVQYAIYKVLWVFCHSLRFDTQHNGIQSSVCKYWSLLEFLFLILMREFSVMLEIGLKCGKITLGFHFF